MFNLSTEVYILAPFVFLAYTTEALSGFGAALVAITLGANFIPIERLVPIVIPLNVIVTSFIVFRHRRNVAGKLLLRQIFPFMCTGLIIGLAVFPLMKEVTLKWLLGLLVVIFSGRQLWMILAERTNGRPMSELQAGIWQLLAGITHALYTTGGPLLTYSVSRINLPKAVFRATMCSVWATLNSALIIIFAMNGRLGSDSLRITAPLVVLLPLGILLGEWLHERINERAFRIFIYGLLLLSGLPLIVR